VAVAVIHAIFQRVCLNAVTTYRYFIGWNIGLDRSVLLIENKYIIYWIVNCILGGSGEWIVSHVGLVSSPTD